MGFKIETGGLSDSPEVQILETYQQNPMCSAVGAQPAQLQGTARLGLK
jgi:hypothetical protein